jgi:hypothetical protein
VLVPGGTHSIEVRQDGYLPVRREIEVAGQQSLTVAVELKEVKSTVNLTRIEKRDGLPRALFWSGVGTTGVLALGGVGFGLHALAKHNRAEDRNEFLPVEDQKRVINRSKTAADILFVSAGIVAAGTTVVYFLTDWGEARDIGLSPAVGSDGAGLVFGGTF